MDPVFEIITDQSSIACYCCCFLNLIFALFLFLFSSHYFKKVSMDPVSQRFGHPHSHIPSVLGIPFSYYCSVLGIPRYPPGMPKSLVFWSSPPERLLDFAGKSKTF